MRIIGIPYVEQHDLCIWTTVPNEKIDGHKANDLFCRTFDVDSHLSSLSKETTKPLSFDLQNTPLEAGNIIWVYDTQGRTVYQIKALKNSFFYDYTAVQNLPMGVYFVQLRQDNNLKYTSFFKR